MRFLRNQDRDLHQESYPALKFPEIYLLENGYKEFYAEQPTHCQPMDYLPMCHPDHKGDLNFYRTDSKMYEAKSSVATTRKVQTSQVRMKKRGNLFDWPTLFSMQF